MGLLIQFIMSLLCFASLNFRYSYPRICKFLKIDRHCDGLVLKGQSDSFLCAGPDPFFSDGGSF